MCCKSGLWTGKVSYKIISEGGISAVSGQGVIVNLKLKRTLVAFLLQKKSNIMLASETALPHEVIFLICLVVTRRQLNLVLHFGYILQV